MLVYIKINAFAIGERGMPYRYAYQNSRCPTSWAIHHCNGDFGIDFGEEECIFNAHTVSSKAFSGNNYNAFRRWYDKYINNLPIKQVTEKESK